MFFRHVACEEARHDEAVMLVKRGARFDILNKVSTFLHIDIVTLLDALPKVFAKTCFNDFSAFQAEKSPLDLAEPGLRKTLQRLADSG